MIASGPAKATRIVDLAPHPLVGWAGSAPQAEFEADWVSRVVDELVLSPTPIDHVRHMCGVLAAVRDRYRAERLGDSPVNRCRTLAMDAAAEMGATLAEVAFGVQGRATPQKKRNRAVIVKRLRREFSADVVADALGVTKSNVSHLEREALKAGSGGGE